MAYETHVFAERNIQMPRKLIILFCNNALFFLFTLQNNRTCPVCREEIVES